MEMIVVAELRPSSSCGTRRRCGCCCCESYSTCCFRSVVNAVDCLDVDDGDAGCRAGCCCCLNVAADLRTRSWRRRLAQS